MGRKQKLREAKRKQKTNNKNAAPVLTPLSPSTTKSTTTVTPIQTDPVKEHGTTTSTDYCEEFPKSVFFRQGEKLLDRTQQTDVEYVLGTFRRGAIEQGCVPSMEMLGRFHTLEAAHGSRIHLALPWLLESAIRGSYSSSMKLVTELYYEATPQSAEALMKYWITMINKQSAWCAEVDQESSYTIPKAQVKEFNTITTTECAVCERSDSHTVTLQQCKGCSSYCYCSKACQRRHWEEQNHRSECKQFQLLEKYHLPYAKEIYRAATTTAAGTTTRSTRPTPGGGGRGVILPPHPALAKLRTKLGLTRPLHDYQALMDGYTTTTTRSTHNNGSSSSSSHGCRKKPIIPSEYVIARNDGTVWIGSTPKPMGPFAMI